MAKEQDKNYTEAQEQLIREAVEANGGVGNLEVAKGLAADERMNHPEKGERTPRMIVAKMARMNVNYARKVPTSKDGSPVTRKSDLVDRIARAVGLDDGSLDTLDKGSKGQLTALAEAVEALAA